jgi:1,4-dihydroxy-2-naphthoate octaprenyltransferase
MMQTSTLLHLRIPFSFFLLPVFLFALSISAPPSFFNFLLVLIIVHLFLYPASNGYNSFFDKDKSSIGGLEFPPEVSRELYFTSLILDTVAILLGFLVNWHFAVMLFVYGIISKAYSHPGIRLKKYPFIGWFMAGFFQGFFTFLMVYIGINNIYLHEIANLQIYYAASLTSLLLWGSYPMTQIYQHEEDGQRGDHTLSLILGIKGTFYFTAIVFLVSNLAFILFYLTFYSLTSALAFQLFIVPMLIYFLYWYSKVHKEKKQANYRNTMRLNLISAICLNTFFLLFYFLNHNGL